MKRIDNMLEVSVCKPHQDGTKKWVKNPVTTVDKDKYPYRCAYCGGEVNLHQGKTVTWHAKHKNIDDAIKCPGSPAMALN